MTLEQSDLDRCIGSENAYSHKIGSLGIQYTDGVRILATKGQAFWLIDMILSHQISPLLRTPKLSYFQLWELTVNENKTAKLTCKADSDLPEIISEKIAITDFPLPYVKLYLVNQILMLSSEY